ncbi:MAG: hypothetical protein V1863_06625 [Candidatus Omnitrophota bacterium]
MVKKIGIVACAFFALALVVSFAMAQEEAVKTEKAMATTEATPMVEAAVNVGNKVCPVTDMAIAEGDMGKYTVEYEGKIYNLSGAECKEEFLKDPAKYISKINEELEGEEAGEVPSQEEAAEIPQTGK